jgi:hypothetical protein
LPAVVPFSDTAVASVPATVAAQRANPPTEPRTASRQHHDEPRPEAPGGGTAGASPASSGGGGGGFSHALFAVLTALIGVAALPLLERVLSAAANRRSALFVSLLERPG